MQTPDQYKIVRDATAAREAAEAKLVEATTELERQRQKFRDWERHAAEAQLAHAKPTSKRRRLDQLEEAESNVRVAQEAVQIAHQREKDAKREARSRALRSFSTEYSKAIKELDEALELAAKANERVQRVYHESQDALGTGHFEPVMWQELSLNSDADSRIKAWRRFIYAYRSIEPVSKTDTTDEINEDAVPELREERVA